MEKEHDELIRLLVDPLTRLLDRPMPLLLSSVGKKSPTWHPFSLLPVRASITTRCYCYLHSLAPIIPVWATVALSPPSVSSISPFLCRASGGRNSTDAFLLLWSLRKEFPAPLCLYSNLSCPASDLYFSRNTFRILPTLSLSFLSVPSLRRGVWF